MAQKRYDLAYCLWIKSKFKLVRIRTEWEAYAKKFTNNYYFYWKLC